MLKTEKFAEKEFEPKRFEADGSLVLNGQTIPYHTVAEDNVFYNTDGKPVASIFSYSYFRSDVKDPSTRPVLFGYNGGPGSSSMYVHAGFLGAKRIVYGDPDRPTALPPYEVIDNPNCLLDIADIVLVDPVGTGYGVLIDESLDKQFYGIEQDAEALLSFIEQWMQRYSRWTSPKYLVGESYGCTRSAAAAGIAATSGKERSYSIAFDGIVMIGNTVTTGKYFGENVPAEPAVLGMPTYAAVNWYHNHPSNQTVEEFVAEAKEFADTEYLLALYQGSRLDPDQREHVIKRLMYYTGVSREYLESRDLRIEDNSFRQNVLKDKGLAVSRYDGRITRELYMPDEDERRIGTWDDATDDRYSAYFYGALNGVILPSLNVKLNRTYVSSLLTYRTWDREEKMGTTGEHLRKAMHQTPGMRTFFANGWYDVCTETGILWYMLDHARLPMDRVCFKGYGSGHMIYIGEDNVKELCDDIREFITGGMPGK